ncbi:hypothetical protein CLPUN_31050 [Clostridium puniceum]|uniref:Uncharacterized protein n=1 Tax=Clostridium puniceum TaxID=29367 RepID=A0A1S8TD81_9CLOT|nr:hypothetical protein [Clostridium puniceum]OOM75750.1 hypothetical protein CLPUN_31050 [Clostridium puniceum]
MSSSLKAFFNVTIGFLPLILLWSIEGKIGLVLGFVCVLMLLIKGIINKNIGIMSRVLLAYFSISNIIYFYLNIDSVLQHKYLTSYIVLALTGFISIMLGKPYTMYEARSGYDKEFGKSPLFIEVNILITKIWTVIYLINVMIQLTGHNIMTVVIMNMILVIGIILSITIPGAFPEV